MDFRTNCKKTPESSLPLSLQQQVSQSSSFSSLIPQLIAAGKIFCVIIALATIGMRSPIIGNENRDPKMLCSPNPKKAKRTPSHTSF
jgi:hypothetical protein